MYLTNAFSLNMLVDRSTTLTIEEVDVSKLKSILTMTELVSAVGHADTAKVFSAVLGREIAPNRVDIKLTRGDAIVVGQYIGPRLPEGATTLPEGATIKWFLVGNDCVLL